MKISVVIPSRNEQFLNPTIEDLLKKAHGDIEIIVNLDGYWHEPMIGDPRVVYIHRGEALGMRQGINAAVAIAKGEYIMKLDAHCMLDEGFDEKLLADMQDDWVVIPRRNRLDAENWTLQDVGKPPIDYEYLCFPDDPNDFGGAGLHGKIWNQRTVERMDNPAYLIDDNMSFQGSCWFMKKDYFQKLGLMEWEKYGPFWQEAQEIGLKTWLSGGRVVTNKKTWYAHLHKGKKYGRGYRMSEDWLTQGVAWTKRWILNEAWDFRQTRKFEWLIEHFWPVPTWPNNWKEVLYK